MLGSFAALATRRFRPGRFASMPATSLSSITAASLEPRRYSLIGAMHQMTMPAAGRRGRADAKARGAGPMIRVALFTQSQSAFIAAMALPPSSKASFGRLQSVDNLILRSGARGAIISDISMMPTTPAFAVIEKSNTMRYMSTRCP